MKLAMFDDGSGPKSGIVADGKIAPTGIAKTVQEIIPDWETMRDDILQTYDAKKAIPLSGVELLAPVSRPGKIFAIGLNYADHISESEMATPEHQVWFTKAVTSINAPYAAIETPKTPGGPYTDYEVELVAIIGKRGRLISKEDAPSYVFGYCVGNDVTERMWQHRTAQWSLGKSFDTHAPIGPWITTADEITDPHALNLSCYVNGEKRQNSNTRHLIFNIWEQIEHLSEAMTLEPGDLIFTGTPGGVGAAMDPRRFLQSGDVVRCEIEKLGTIEGTMT